MIYLTYNDQPSGVFSSQVNDVCNYLNHSMDARIRLVAIISLHDFLANRKKIRSEVPGAVVLPALPKAKYWKFSCLVFTLVCLVMGENKVIARNILASKIALFVKKTGLVKRVCLDGRGAIAAEWNEYDVVAHENMKASISTWERCAVLESDYRIAVSQKLVDWWRTAYGYKGNAHVVIPCTLQTAFDLNAANEATISELRKKEGFATDDIILVYSGSTSGWQSFSALESLLGSLLSKNFRYKLIFLSKANEIVEKMKSNFPGQVFNTWLSHAGVQSFLTMCDYGILYREQSITNQVASPTKFAEYLSAGLPVLISPGIGDYSDFVLQHDCGMVIQDTVLPEVTKTTMEKRKAMVNLVSEYFTKTANRPVYTQLLDFMKNN